MATNVNKAVTTRCPNGPMALMKLARPSRPGTVSQLVILPAVAEGLASISPSVPADWLGGPQSPCHFNEGLYTAWPN